MKDTRLHPRFIDYRTPTNPHGLRYLEGEAGETGSAPAGTSGQEGQATTGEANTGQGAQTPSPATVAAQQAAHQQTQGDPGKGEEPGTVEDLPEWAQKIINDARDGEAKARTSAKQQAADEARTQLAQEIGKALGLVKDGDETPKPEELLTKAQEAQTKAEQAAADTARELAIYRNAHTAGLDPDKVLDSRKAMAALTDVDHADTTKLAEALKALANDNTHLRARAAGASTIDTSGGTGERSNTTRHVSLEEGAAAYYGT